MVTHSYSLSAASRTSYAYTLCRSFAPDLGQRNLQSPTLDPRWQSRSTWHDHGRSSQASCIPPTCSYTTRTSRERWDSCVDLYRCRPDDCLTPHVR
jgi:hypothetical protein